MAFNIQQAVLDLGVIIRGVEIKGIDNHAYSPQLEAYIEAHIQELLANETLDSIKNDEIIQGFYTLHQAVNVPKRKNLPASENLLKLLLKKQGFFKINPVVDLYNLLSMESKLALGAHDLNKVSGNISLRLTEGNELFIPLGQSEPKEVKEGVYSYIDGKEVICYLEIRQVNKTAVNKDSKDLFFIVQGNQNTSQEYVDEVSSSLIALITKYLGGEGRLLPLDTYE